MLDVLRRGQRWWTALVVVFVGGVFAVFIGLGGPLQTGAGDSVVLVGDYRIGLQEFERERARREDVFREALGDQFNARNMRDSVDTVTARTLVERGVLALQAQELGLTVAKREVERDIVTSGAFVGEDGRFNKDAFRDWVSYEFGSERAFREQQQRATLAQKLLRVLRTQALVSEGEARDAVVRRLEEVTLAFTVLSTDEPPAGFEAGDAEVAEFLATREEEARKLYQERSDRYDVPERTRARHILLRVASDAEEEQIAAVEANARAARDRILAGEDFADVAEEVSEDPGSASNGGDLGFFRRGQMVAAFDEAAFSLEPGTVSEPIRTEYGFHVIRVEEREAASSQTFEEVREEIAGELLGRAAARDLAWEMAEALSEQVRGGASLEDAARGMELTLERTGWLKRRPDGYVPGLGAAPDLSAVAFTLEAGQSSPRIFEVGDKLALVQVLERKEPAPADIEAEVETERAALEAAKLNRLTESWVGVRREQLLESGELQVNLDALGRRG